MCILCVASRWSRRVVAMLPWLVFPLTLVWALSQFLPPGFRFEITSPRVACVAVLFASLMWYEVVMPKLYTWRDRRRTVLRERKRIEAHQTAKWRKEATRRCRNCFTAYKEQTPAGGRFMCTFCGHVSRRPVLDVPGGAPSAGNSFSLAGAAMGFVTGGGLFPSRSSKIWNVRGSQERPTGERSWNGDRPWIDGGSLGANGSWSAGSWPGSPLYFRSAESGWAGLWNFAGGEDFGQDGCSAAESYFGFFWLVLRILLQLLFFVGSMWRKLCRAGFSGEDGMGGGRRSHSSGECASPSPETRGERARRKAEEKRIARLEKEQLEFEERKQREEVARLVEERRRQRDEKLEAEKNNEKEACIEKERDIKGEKEAEKRRLEKSREKVHSKEKSKEQETEELKKRKGKDIEKKADADKSLESEKIFKGTKLNAMPKGSEAGPKIPRFSRWGSSKGVGSARTGFFSKSKNVAASFNSATSFWGRSLSVDSKHLGQSSKTATPAAASVASTSNPNTASNGKPGKVSGSAWNKIHWTNVWGKAGNKVPIEISSKSDVVEGTDNIVELSDTDGGKCLVDGAIVSPSAVGVFRQPIAPPSSLSGSRDNLFSGPVGFPPVQLPVDSSFEEQRRVQTGNMIPNAPDFTSSYFGSPSLAACAGTRVLRSCTCSEDIDPTSASLPSSVSSPLNTINFAGPEFDPVSTAFLSSSVNGHGNISSPLSSLNVSSSTIATGSEGLEFRNAKQEQLFQSLEPRSLPPDSFLSGTASRDSPAEGVWHNWSAPLQLWRNFAQPFVWDAPCQQGIDPLHPSRATLLQPNLEQQSHFSSRIFSMENKAECPDRHYDMNQGVSPEFGDCIAYPLMYDPVITADGSSYERSANKAWLKFKSPEMLINPSQNVAAAGSAWSGIESMARPPTRGFFPSPGVKSVWSSNNNAG